MHSKRLEEISLSEIVPNRFQPRIHFDDAKIESLAKSIMTYGVLEPIIVRPLGGKFEIVAGERRFKASKMAGKSTIPAIVVDFNDKESIELALLENIQRQELTAIEEAIAYRRILDMGQITQEELAKKTGKSQPTIANKMRLLALDDETQEALIEHKISERHARSLLKLAGTPEELDMLDLIIDKRLTVRDTDREIAKLLESKKEKIKKEEKGENRFMDIEKIMQEAQDINASEEPKNLNNFVTTPSPYDTIFGKNEQTPQVDDIASIMGNNLPEEQNKFINIIPREEEKEEPKESVEHPTVTFDNVFNSVFDVPMAVEPQETEVSSVSSLDSVSAAPEAAPEIPNFESVNDVIIPNIESASNVVEDITPMNVEPLESGNSIETISSIEPVSVPEIEEPVSPNIEVPTVSTLSDIPEFTSTIAESAPNFENTAPVVPEITPTEISIPIETVDVPNSIVNDVQNIPTIDPVVLPTIEDSITDSSYDTIELLDLPESKIEPAVVNSIPGELEEKDFSKVLDILKECSEKIKSLGYEINTSEFDLKNIYQVTILINK